MMYGNIKALVNVDNFMQKIHVVLIVLKQYLGLLHKRLIFFFLSGTRLIHVVY